MLDMSSLAIADLDAGLAIGGEHGGGNGRGIVAEELGAGDVVDGGVGELVAQALEDGDGVGGGAVVVAEQHLGLVGERADDGDLDAGWS